ncbi:hypothetical protein H0W32_03060, partial [Patescibacteria group bacterium]|nr:hypothetical protein [Patescibacteria group bacterium]
RMAPQLALSAIEDLSPLSTVLDPMLGSGTVVRVAANAGHYAIGRDVDPLAVLMAKVWTTPIDTGVLRTSAQEMVVAAKELSHTSVLLPWIDNDYETRAFTEFWFADTQRQHLRQLSHCLSERNDEVGDALRVAMSRIIITKDRGASLARDVSHSRPHKVAESNNYPVFEGFLDSVKRLARRLDDEPPLGHATIIQGDARNTALTSQTIDAVITSPPYLNAIDYLRGHRLALVWMGHQISELRSIRGGSIGTERSPEQVLDRKLIDSVLKRLELPVSFPKREHRIIERYISDLNAMLIETHRVLKPGGMAVFVIGNSCLKEVFIWNSRILSSILAHLGFKHESHYSRTLPASRRYLPPPSLAGTNNFERRMRKEVILTYRRI